ncbi:MAG: M20 family metallopeptidase [Planctomycetota bacterium]|nr:M20 family metallopeptidase [Planctomycetota bacterium]MDA1141776.1 M20 family metallopeptidase [Planctomycetota bacterium]
MNYTSCTELLQVMVRIDSVNRQISGKPEAEAELSDFMEKLAVESGFATCRFPVSGEYSNLMISCELDADAPWLLFESHLDTVTVEGMTIDPFGGVIEKGRLWGRGACDTKGTGAAMFWALQQYSQGDTRPNNIAILYTVDEEVSKTGAKVFVRDHLSDLDWMPTGVIVGEPTVLRPIVAHNGVVRWNIETAGIAAHSSNPPGGRSAISAMVKVIDVLESKYIPSLAASHPLTGKAQCSINVIRGGTLINIIPEHCLISIDRRIVPGEDPHEVLPAVEKILNELRQQVADIQVKQATPTMIDPPLDPRGGEPLASFVCDTLQKMGLPAEPEGVPFGTDGSAFSVVGIPTLVIGPGDIAQAHTCDEWIDLEQLERGSDVYERLMQAPLGSE